MISAQRRATIAVWPASCLQGCKHIRRSAAEAAMFRKLFLCLLLGIVALGAQQAGADRFMLLGIAGLAALGLLGRGDRAGRA